MVSQPGKEFYHVDISDVGQPVVKSKKQNGPMVLRWITILIVSSAFFLALKALYLGGLSPHFESYYEEPAGEKRGFGEEEVIVVKDSLIVTSSSADYGVYSSYMSSYPFLDGGILAEPYRDTLINVTNSLSECNYEWSLQGPLNSNSRYSSELIQGASGVGNQYITISPSHYGTYILNITEVYGSDATVGRTLQQTVFVRYVRRELTSLTDSDREEFLDAYYTLWSTNTVDGKGTYGDEYKSLFYFASLHNDGKEGRYGHLAAVSC